MITSSRMLFEYMEDRKSGHVILFPAGLFKRREKNEEFRRLAARWNVTRFDLPEKSDSFVLLSPGKNTAGSTETGTSVEKSVGSVSARTAKE